MCVCVYCRILEAKPDEQLAVRQLTRASQLVHFIKYFSYIYATSFIYIHLLLRDTFLLKLN